MFNEAFWFFYMIGVAGALSAIACTFLVINVIAAIIGLMGYLIEESTGAYKMFKVCATIAIIAAFFVVFIPSQTALLAGGTQYAVEATELDDTLRSFKTIIDTRIAELTSDTQEQE